MNEKILNNIEVQMDLCRRNGINYLIYIFGLIFVISGLALILTAILVLLDVQEYKYFAGENLLISSITLIFAGCFAFIVAPLSCYGARNKTSKSLYLCVIVLLIMLIIELAAAITAVSWKSDMQNELDLKLERAILRRNKADMTAWNNVHVKLMCCGMNGPKDWYDTNNKTMPTSCCVPYLISTDINDCKDAPSLFMDRYYTDGCLVKLKDIFNNDATALVKVGFTIAGITLLGMAVLCYQSFAFK